MLYVWVTVMTENINAGVSGIGGATSSAPQYLKLKNKLFFSVLKQLKKNGGLSQALYYLEDEYSHEDKCYYDLIALYFVDDGGYQRALFIPAPIFMKKRGMKKLLQRYLLESHVVSREWHDRFNIQLPTPTSYDPPETLKVVEGPIVSGYVEEVE